MKQDTLGEQWMMAPITGGPALNGSVAIKHKRLMVPKAWNRLTFRFGLAQIHQVQLEPIAIPILLR